MRDLSITLIFLIGAIILSGCVGETPEKVEKKEVTIKIGVLVPKTGRFQNAGVFIENAAKLAKKHAEEIGVRVELEFADCGDSPEKTKSAFIELSGKGVNAIVGAYSSAQAISAAEAAQQTSTLYMVSVASTTQIEKAVLDGNRYVFRNAYNTSYWGELAAEFIRLSGAEGYYFQGFQPLRTFNQGMLDVIKERTDVELKEESYYNPSADPKDVYNKAIDAASKMGEKDVLVLGDPGSLSVSYLKEYRSNGGKGIVYSVGGVLALPQTLRSLGEIADYTAFQAASLEGVMETEYTKKYFSEYREEFGVEANNYAGVLTYDSILILAQAAQKADDVTSDKLIEVLEKGSFTGAAGIYRFNDAHQAEWGSDELKGKIAEWVNGDMLVVYPEEARESDIVWQ
jgi:branched-chain amino acid transport system substrate-binding protein